MCVRWGVEGGECCAGGRGRSDEIGKACGDRNHSPTDSDTSCHSTDATALRATLPGEMIHLEGGAKRCQMCRKLPGTHTLTLSRLCAAYAFSQG